MIPLMVVPAIFVLGLCYVLLPVLVQDQMRFEGPREVTCPETHGPATVELDASQAAITGLLGKPKLHLARCSKWQGRGECAQECLTQIHVGAGGYPT